MGTHRPRVLVLADVGSPSYHVGDEAVGQAAAARLAERGLTPVVVSNGRHLAADYEGLEVVTGPPLPLDRVELVGAHRALAADPAAAERGRHGPALEAIARNVGAVDAVLVAGGGNLASAFDWLLYQRIAHLLLAQRRGLPTAVSGQTLGPVLVGADIAELAPVMGAARTIGLRERRSSELGRRIQPRDVTADCLDDAQFFGPFGADEPGAGVLAAGGAPRTVVATVAPPGPHVHPGEQAERFARDLVALHERTGCRILLVPHKGRIPGAGGEDEAVAEDIQRRARCPMISVEPVTSARRAAEAVGEADLVITNRYHPVVFALARGVPVLPLVEDDYADARIDGVLDRWGLAGRGVPVRTLDEGEITPAALAVWEERGAYVAHIRAAAPDLRAFHEQWWDALAARLAADAALAVPLPWLCRPRPLPAPPLLAGLRRRGLPALRLTGELAQLRAELLEERAENRLARHNDPNLT